MPGDRTMWLVENRLTIKQLVRQVGYSFGTIRSELHENGVAMRDTGVGKRAVADVQSKLTRANEAET